MSNARTQDIGNLALDEAAYFELSMAEGEGDDLTILHEVSPEAIAKVLAKRYSKEMIYTAIGPVLIAVNPYKLITTGKINIYDPKVAAHFYNHTALEVGPHVFKIASEAYKDLKLKFKSQCVIVTGESGAGKTETAKQLMNFLTTINGTTTGADEQGVLPELQATTEEMVNTDTISSMLLESNPVLEAFGNAQTIRNDNSSRFGKYMELQFNFKAQVVGGRVTKYLLEKSRLVHQNKGERSFHVFYQLLTGASEEERAKYKLRPNFDYDFLTREARTIEGVNDALNYERLKKSMEVVGITAAEQDNIFRLLAATLLLGELEFDDHGLDQRATISTSEILTDVAGLLQVEPTGLEWALTSSILASATKSKSINRRVKDRTGSIFNRDSLAKELYKRIFDFIVDRINSNIEHQGKRSKTIGLLDIYGFEVFDNNNGFEQLCINYVNEKLQQYFLELTLEGEQKVYKEEGLEWNDVAYYDNKPVCEVIESKPNGIFEVLDMQCTFKEATAEQLVNSLVKSTSSNPCFLTAQALIKAKLAFSPNLFGIKHYAGDVIYTIDSFIEKNRDTLTQDLLSLMESSENELAAKLFYDGRTPEEKAKRPPTISLQFRRQVNNLMTSLKACKPHYIRCVKPNDKKQAGLVDLQRVTFQVQYLGLKENVLVRRSGYCYRGRYADFTSRYNLLCSETWKSREATPDVIRVLLTTGTSKGWSKDFNDMEPFRLEEGHDYVIGKTMVFIKDPETIYRLEARRARILPTIATKIQARVRAHAVREWYKKIVADITLLEACARRMVWMARYRRMKQATLAMQAAIRMWLAKRKVRAIRIQFKNKPPRIWARKLQRYTRGHMCRSGLEPKFYAKTVVVRKGIKRAYRRNTSSRKLGAWYRAKLYQRLYKDMVRKHRASVKLGSWYRSKLYHKHYLHLKHSTVVAQCAIRVHQARRAKKQRADEEYEEMAKLFKNGMELVKFTQAGNKAHTKNIKFSGDQSKLEWASPFWARKEGIKFDAIYGIKKGLGEGSTSYKGVTKEEAAKIITVVSSSRTYCLEAPSEHARDAVYRFMSRRNKETTNGTAAA